MPTIEYSNVNRQHIKFDGNRDTDSAYVINYNWQTPGNGSSTYTIKKNSTYGVMTTESGLSGTISGVASNEGVYEYTLDTYLLDVEAWTFTLKDESGADSITNGNFTRDGSKLSWKWSDGATINGTLVVARRYCTHFRCGRPMAAPTGLYDKLEFEKETSRYITCWFT